MSVKVSRRPGSRALALLLQPLTQAAASQLILAGNALWGSELHAADGDFQVCLRGSSQAGQGGPSISVHSGQQAAELLGEQASYAPGRSLRLLDAGSRSPVAVLEKQLASRAPAVQRSLLAQREQLRASQAADQEAFTLKLAGGPSFTAKRTYPGLEVIVYTTSGARAASISCRVRTFLQLAVDAVWSSPRRLTLIACRLLA